jgi:hypothetical protein
VFSVIGGVISSCFILISDEGQVFNLFSQSNFLIGHLVVVCLLSINILLFKGIQEVKGGTYGIFSSGLHVYEVG